MDFKQVALEEKHLEKEGFKEKYTHPADLKLYESFTVTLISPGAAAIQCGQLSWPPARLGGFHLFLTIPYLLTQAACFSHPSRSP